jgi:conjugal transfer mating pair stabilization protein TraN
MPVLAKKKRVVNSRLKAFQTFADNFDGLGLKSGWKSYRGSWVLGSNVAISSTNPSDYAISAVKLSVPNFTASAGVTSGTGLAYWVSDAGSWVASVSYNTTTTSYPCNANQVTSYSNPPSGSCCGGVTTIAGTPAYSYGASWSAPYSYNYNATWNGGYSYSYTATWNPSYSYTYTAQWNSPYSYTYTASYQAPYSYSYSATYNAGYSYTASSSYTAQSYCCGTWNIAKSYAERINGVSLCYQCSGPCSDAYSFSQCCPSGTTKSGSSCYYPASTTYSCPNGGSLSGGFVCVVPGSYSCPSGGSLSGSTCYVSVSGGYSCPSGGSLSGSTCTVSVAGNWSCPSGGSLIYILNEYRCSVTVDGYYSCPSGGSVSGSSCQVSVAGYYSCPSGGSLSGSTCTVNVSGYYYCPSGGSLSGSTCNVAAGANQYSCFTGTTTQTNYNYYLKVIKSVGGVVSQVGSDVALPSQPAAIKVISSGNNIESTAYSTVTMLTATGTRTDTITTPSPTGTVGVIKSPSDYAQGSTVSKFSATI